MGAAPAGFVGDHYVEAYAVKNGICVARSRTAVPI
ncbi:MAG: nucleotide-binding domain-containing protein [Pseudomonadota bacterium]